MRVGEKCLGDFFIEAPEREVEMDHKIERSGMRRPRRDTEECGQGLHAILWDKLGFSSLLPVSESYLLTGLIQPSCETK